MKLIKRFPTSRGFTLIELLVVIAIIAILAALLFPATKRARRRGRLTLARHEIAQLETAFKAYFEEYHHWPEGVIGDEAANPVDNETFMTGAEITDAMVRMLKGEDVNGQNPKLIPLFSVGGGVVEASR